MRDATKSKNYSEEYVRLDPGRADAYIALGLYNYYADIAPAFLKLLRVLLFIPGGDRSLGLQQLERAAREGELWAPQAKLELIQIYGWLEGRVDEAVVSSGCGFAPMIRATAWLPPGSRPNRR